MTDIARRSWWYYGEQPGVAIITLTDTQIKVLPSTPVTIITAPGVGKALLLLRGVAVADVRAGVYTNVSSGLEGLLYLSIQGAGAVSNVATLSGLITDASERQLAHLTVAQLIQGTPSQIVDNGPLPVSLQENLPLQISAANVLGNFTGGHPNNTLKATVYYLVVDL